MVDLLPPRPAHPLRHEVELKLRLEDPELLETLRGSHVLWRRFPRGPLHREVHEDLYLDTPSWDLWQRGWALRLRRRGDGPPRLTAKALQLPDARGVARRAEWEASVPPEWASGIFTWDQVVASLPEWAATLEAVTWTGELPLRPLLTLRQLRERATVHGGPGGEAFAELSLDRVQVVAPEDPHGRVVAEFHEVELELLTSGEAAPPFHALVEGLSRLPGALPVQTSKLETGLQALGLHPPSRSGPKRPRWEPHSPPTAVAPRRGGRRLGPAMVLLSLLGLVVAAWLLASVAGLLVGMAASTAASPGPSPAALALLVVPGGTPAATPASMPSAAELVALVEHTPVEGGSSERPSAVTEPGAPFDRLQSTAPRARTYRDLFQAVAAEFGLDWRLLAALAYRESRLNPWALGQDNDMGLMQIIPETWAEFAPLFQATDPFDPQDNVRVGAAYLVHVRGLLSDMGYPEWPWALAAYNWGPENVARVLRNGADWNRIPGPQRRYVDDILRAAFGMGAMGP